MEDIVTLPWPQLLLFMLSVLAVASFVITVAGQFPAEHRDPALARSPGSVLLWATMLAGAVAGIGTLAFAWLVLPLPFAIIGAGLMILVAPYVLHPLPNHVINGRSCLLALTALALLAAGGMWLSVPGTL